MIYLELQSSFSFFRKDKEYQKPLPWPLQGSIDARPGGAAEGANQEAQVRCSIPSGGACMVAGWCSDHWAGAGRENSNNRAGLEIGGGLGVPS